MSVADWILLSISAVAVVGIVAWLVWKKKTGRGGCGCGCQGCPHAGACHSADKEKKNV